MLLSLYRALTTVCGPLLRVVLLVRARRGKEDRARLAERSGQASLPRPAGQLVWVHGASVGESLAALPLVDLMLARCPTLEILITTGTVTSARVMSERLPARARHQFVPLDRPAAWRRFFAHWRPDLGILIESELWPNLIGEAARHALPLVLVNGRISTRSFVRWQRLPTTARRLLAGFRVCLAQSEADGARLRALGARHVEVVGNLKLAADPLAADRPALDALRAALGARPVWLAASTHAGEEAVLGHIHKELLARWPDLLLMVVPRHPERGRAVADEAERLGLKTARRAAGELPTGETRIYVGDTLGELGLFYRLSPFALIGGSLVPHGGQNPLEAARLGCVPILGPHTQNFAEITASLLEQGAALRVDGPGELLSTVSALLGDPSERAALADRAERAARAQADVLETTYRALRQLLDPAGCGAQP